MAAQTESDDFAVSAIITAYNCEKYLKDAIDSVLAQTRPVDEILVVDDGSTDRTADITRRYAKRVTYLYQENQGVGATRNTGLQNATGDLIAFLDCDDIWLKDKTAKQIAFLKSHPDAAMVSGQKIWRDESRNVEWVESRRLTANKNFQRELVIQNIVGNPSMTLIRQETIAQAGLFNPDFPWGQDWEWWIRISKIGVIGFIQEPVIVYRWHAGGVSHYKPWARLDCLERISTTAANSYQPAFWRPILKLRVKSRFAHERARRLPKNEGKKAFLYALQALLLYPFDNTKGRLITFFRATFGNRIYQRIKNLKSFVGLKKSP